MIYRSGSGSRRAAFAELCSAVAGWLVLGPLTWVVPRRKDLVLFYGRDGGKFSDNCKHLFAAAVARPGIGQSVFLARDEALRDRLRAEGASSEVATSWRGIWLWLRAGTLCVDSIDWMRGFRYAGSRGVRLLQMWHGIPLKHVQLARITTRRQTRSRLYMAVFGTYLSIVGRYARADWFLSTSRYVTEHAFAGSFRYDRVSHAGYPRNDALFGPVSALSEMGVDRKALTAIAEHRSRSGRALVAMYAPTFRESLQDPFADGTVDLALLSQAASRMAILLLVKLHPWMQDRIQCGELPGIVFVQPDSDAYPLLREVDFLITDYSSVFFDYLLLDRPIVFFSYDLADYLLNERAMYFEYAQMTPGPKVESTAALIKEFARIAAGEDDWKSERARVRDLVFDHQDGHAADRLLDELFPGTARALTLATSGACTTRP